MPHTEFELLGGLRRADIGDFNLGKSVEVRLPFESPQGPSTNRIFVTEIDVVIRDREGKVSHRDTH